MLSCVGSILVYPAPGGGGHCPWVSAHSEVCVDNLPDSETVRTSEKQDRIPLGWGVDVWAEKKTIPKPTYNLRHDSACWAQTPAHPSRTWWPRCPGCSRKPVQHEKGTERVLTAAHKAAGAVSSEMQGPTWVYFLNQSLIFFFFHETHQHSWENFENIPI